MNFSTTGSSGTTTQQLSPAEENYLNTLSGSYGQITAPAQAAAVQNSMASYNQNIGGVTNAAQNLAGVSNQAQNVLGSTGQSALTSGVNALQNITSPAYQQAQIQAAMQPAEAQYAQNIAGLNASFGGAGQIGSARQALAQQQTAGSTQAAQETAAAQALQGIANQQITAGGQLGQLGLSGLGGAQNAAQTQVTAAGVPFNTALQLASSLYGTPVASANPFAATQGQTTSTNNSTFGINALPGLSDVRAKENIEYVGIENGHKMYEFNYIDQPQRYRGVMAQDIVEYKPSAVRVRADGMLVVDYAQLGVTMTEVKGRE